MANFFRKRNTGDNFDFENIFLDSKNVSKMDEDKFEGFIEQSIPKNVIYTVPIVFLILIIFYSVKIFNLQVVSGEKYFSQSENNRLNNSLIFNQRGVIYDRNGVELAWNEEKEEGDDFALRRYIKGNGFSHLLGFVSYPLRDSSGNFYKTAYEGKAGIEKSYDDFLNGEPGLKIIEVDAIGKKISESAIKPGFDGENITLTIDARIQDKASELLKEYIDEKDFSGGVGLIMDVKNGNIITMVSVPEYDSNILSDGKDTEKINEFTTNENKAFLNRAILGNYTPGSIVKPFVALGALEEGLVSPERVIYTDGVLEVPNPFLPGEFTFFRDWKNHGPVNMYQAIANSSNIYFFNVGGGFGEVNGLGITKMAKWFEKFGFGEKTGIKEFSEEDGFLPTPDWKEERFGRPWLVGDTYYTAIGQYAFLVTPLQALVGTAAIANGGLLQRPKLIFENQTSGITEIVTNKIDVDQNNLEIVKRGMRQTVTNGTTQSLNLPFVKIASKSGTAERGEDLSKINSWVEGFFPYDDPKYAFVFMAEDGPARTPQSVSFVASKLFKWMDEEGIDEYFE